MRVAMERSTRSTMALPIVVSGQCVVMQGPRGQTSTFSHARIAERMSRHDRTSGKNEHRRR